MGVSNFMHSWLVLLESLATMALILTAFGIMLGRVKPGDAVKHFGAILGVTIVLMLTPGVIVSAWSAIPLWQQVALVGIEIGIWWWVRPPLRKRRWKEK